MSFASLRSLAVACAVVGLAAGCGDQRRSAAPAPGSAGLPRAAAVAMPPAADVAPLVTAGNRFAFELWRAAATTGNVALSPASITGALAMTAAGARGATADELRAVLHAPGDLVAYARTWGQVLGALGDPSRPMTVRIANRLFGQTGYAFERDFLAVTRDAFGAALEPLDFKGDAEAARRTINAWVEQATERRIMDLLPAGAVSETTRLVIANAIDFLSDWAQPFDKGHTFERRFRVGTGDGVERNAMTMHEQARLRLAKADGVAVLELPYRGEGTAMLVILPDAVDGLAAVEQALDADRFAAWRAALTPTDVQVALPRFTIDAAAPIELAPALRQLGMTAVFDVERADLTGIARPQGDARLFVTAVFHKAFVKVDERGTEAAAATAVVTAEGAGPAPRGTLFEADHPFLFAIVDQPTGAVLFLGRVVDPR